MTTNLKNTKKLFFSIEMVFGIDMKEMQSESRIRVVTDARKAIAYFMRTYFKARDGDIAKIINRHRSVVGYMFDGAISLMEHDDEFRKKIEKIKSDTEIVSICPCCQRPY